MAGIEGYVVDGTASWQHANDVEGHEPALGHFHIHHLPPHNPGLS